MYGVPWYHPPLVFLVQSLIRTLTSFKDYTGSLVLAVRMAKLSPVIKLQMKTNISLFLIYPIVHSMWCMNEQQV